MRINAKITLTNGTPINVAVALGIMSAAQQAAYVASAQIGFVPNRYADRVFIQMAKGGTGVGYVMDLTATPKATPNKTTAGQVIAELLAADAANPGGNYSDASYGHDGAGIDLLNMWVDGDANDPMRISANVRV